MLLAGIYCVRMDSRFKTYYCTVFIGIGVIPAMKFFAVPLRYYKLKYTAYVPIPQQ